MNSAASEFLFPTTVKHGFLPIRCVSWLHRLSIQAVLGLGYPSLPIMSVDEWAADRQKKGLLVGGESGVGGASKG